uniref:Uncharacterized protein n=1 Tax=Leptobrachium leishanense TaxID=445787 RepID=A0A8C5PUP4_9ANUR
LHLCESSFKSPASLSGSSIVTSFTFRAGLGRCSSCFWLAVAFDVFGLAVLLIGVFANVFFYDFLIYAGAIVIFLSLIWWVFWYTGNIEVPPEELADDVGLSKKNQGVLGLVRTLSGRLSSSFRRTRLPLVQFVINIVLITAL